MRSTPARYIFLDEVDAYPASTDEEGDPITLAEARSLTFAHRRKVLLVSAPTIRGLSRIEREIRSEKHPQLLISPERRAAVLERYTAGNQALARRRFEREALFLDPLSPADAPITEMRLPMDSEELMSRFVVPFVAALIERNR